MVWTFKIDGITTDLGIIKSVDIALKTNLVTIPPITSGDDAQTIDFGYPYFIYTIQGKFTGTTTTIWNNFLDNIIGALQNKTACLLIDRFGTGGGLDMLVTDISYTDAGGRPNEISYVLTLTETKPIG